VPKVATYEERTYFMLQPENILLSSSQEETLVKVSEFGLCKLVNSNSVLKTRCGTPMYIAPEILETKRLGSYTNKIDIWSLGVILYVW
jgi:serine/threonine-protein kinase Chk2